VIHYHGTPISPRTQLLKMGGRNFCVSFAAPQDFKTCLAIGQTVMLDNGAFSVFTKGKTLDLDGYYAWIEPVLAPPHWAVMPDAIGGDVEAQHKLLQTWPWRTLGYDNCAPVFHLHMPITYLFFLCNAYRKVCLGSSAEFWDTSTVMWERRMDDIFNALVNHYGRVPWIHGLRMLGKADNRWPLASADSTNVAQNFKRDTGCAECKADTIDRINPTPAWQGGLFA